MAVVTNVLHGRAARFPVFQARGHHGSQGKTDAVAHVVGDLLVRGRTHVAGGARRGSKIVLSHDPRIGIEIHLRDVGAELNSVLRFVVNLNLRMVRPHVTLPAVFGLVRLRRAEAVSAVARCAGSLAAVRIHSPDPAVRPRGRVELALPEIFHLTAVALSAPVACRRPAFDDLAKYMVQRPVNCAARA